MIPMNSIEQGCTAILRKNKIKFKISFAQLNDKTISPNILIYLSAKCIIWSQFIFSLSNHVYKAIERWIFFCELDFSLYPLIRWLSYGWATTQPDDQNTAGSIRVSWPHGMWEGTTNHRLPSDPGTITRRKCLGIKTSQRVAIQVF